MLSAAERDLCALHREKAPASVIVAAEYAIQCSKQGAQVPGWCQDRLMAWARSRQQQDRYGK